MVVGPLTNYWILLSLKVWSGFAWEEYSQTCKGCIQRIVFPLVSFSKKHKIKYLRLDHIVPPFNLLYEN